MNMVRITPEYLAEQQLLHAAPRGYGGRGSKWADLVASQAKRFQLWEILDYGCGQATLGAALNARGFFCADYDPAIPAFAADPEQVEFVVCTDVLEHVEEACVDEVLDHLRHLAVFALFVVISLVPTDKTLSDGRQAHITLRPRDWWLDQLRLRFDLVETFDDPEHRPEKQLVAIFKAK